MSVNFRPQVLFPIPGIPYTGKSIVSPHAVFPTAGRCPERVAQSHRGLPTRLLSIATQRPPDRQWSGRLQ